MDGVAPEKFRTLPQLQRLLERPRTKALLADHARATVIAALREALAQARETIRTGGSVPQPDALLAHAEAKLAQAPPGLMRVINATGVVLHTNLGRAPLPPEAVAAIAATASGYSNLEYDLHTGGRGARAAAVEILLCALTGAQAALVVNNNAAAVLLALSAHASAFEVIVSRGELIEIGGGFRIPEVIAQGGARLREVGTTNRTRLADYRAAIGPETRVLLKVHPSNFRITGFTESVPVPALAELARAHKLLVVEDLGSGAIAQHPGGERTMPQAIADGADIVACSGDKLFGGPQSGLLAGSAKAIGALRTHPLLRALRPDKLTLAALEATLRLHVHGRPTPVQRILAQSPEVLRVRAEKLAAQIGAEARPSYGQAGGGTLPDVQIPSYAAVIAFPQHGAEAQLAALRRHTPPVIARARDGGVWLDMLTVTDADLADIGNAVATA